MELSCLDPPAMLLLPCKPRRRLHLICNARTRFLFIVVLLILKVFSRGSCNKIDVMKLRVLYVSPPPTRASFPRHFSRRPPSNSPSNLSPSITGMESVTVETSDGVKLCARLYKPLGQGSNHVVAFVHPLTVLDSFQGLLWVIAMGLAERGFCVVTFNMRGAGRSSGRPSLTSFPEIQDVVAVCKWVSDSLSPE